MRTGFTIDTHRVTGRLLAVSSVTMELQTWPVSETAQCDRGQTVGNPKQACQIT